MKQHSAHHVSTIYCLISSLEFEHSEVDKPIEQDETMPDAPKGFSFVSVVMEPNKNSNKSMKQRDKTKPLIDI